MDVQQLERICELMREATDAPASDIDMIESLWILAEQRIIALRDEEDNIVGLVFGVVPTQNDCADLKAAGFTLLVLIGLVGLAVGLGFLLIGWG